MRQLATFILILVFGICKSQSEKQVNYYRDLPPNPQAGHCYVRCLNNSEDKPKWEDVDCGLLYFQKLELSFEGGGGALSNKDKRLLERTFKNLIKKGISLQLESHYKEARTEAQNMTIAKGRSILVGNYLVELGLNPDFLKVGVLVSGEHKSEINYRIINNSPDGYYYNAETGFWCKPKTEK